MNRNKILAMLGLLLCAAIACDAHAAARAWLDRSQVAMGESVTLTVETDQAADVPDFSPLAADFHLSGQSNSRQLQMANGVVSALTTHALELTPKREGVIAIPSLRVGTQRTAPLALSVSAAPVAPAARRDAMAFLQIDVDDPNPYVQQSVGVTLRLFYAVPLASGQLDLDTPQGASLQRIGDDVQSSRELNGRRYNVVERRFLLVPDRSGSLVLSGARFVGRGAGGWVDDILGGNSRELRADAPPRTLNVRAQPANAPQPWLPLRDLRLRYVGAPQSLRAGEAATLVVEAIAQGATQAQMPELPTPSVPGAQVFAEPPQFEESFNAGSSQVKLTRRYSLVPNGAGKLAVPGIALAWWDVRAGAAKTAALPDLNFDVARGSGNFAASALPDASLGDSATADSAVNTDQRMSIPARVWVWMAVLFAGLWLLTLIWALQRRVTPLAGRTTAPGQPESATEPPTHTPADLKRALDTGDLDEVADVLRGMSTPPSKDIDQLLAHLDSAAQRAAVEQLRRARWADGDGVAARAALREAFRNGPQWPATHKPAKETLPPLYPKR